MSSQTHQLPWLPHASEASQVGTRGEMIQEQTEIFNIFCPPIEIPMEASPTLL